MKIHTKSHSHAGKTVKIKPEVKHFQYPTFGGSDFRLEDYWDILTGGSWMHANGNPAAMVYGMRAGMEGLPSDNEVVYGKVNGLGSLVHVSELELD